ncbi:uncharacterized protein SOCE26_037800 [Sorangium cellulosum]|uniref:Secreted protein n=1 Tax=Sorangium cellulosum TaxID=56 RepID=A0A2L0ESV3_SORCE|nr:hypothetical protein [Sorangium cellulosum]AUX42350.1 uncharacterized protein SOCE26_037800 [Sorangium cellulosum]
MNRRQTTPLFALALLCLHCGSSSEAGSNQGAGSGSVTTGAGSGSASAGGSAGDGGGSASAGGGSAGDGGGSASAGGGSAGEGGGGGGGCRPPDNPAVFEIGTGEACFRRVQHGATLPVMAGPQGRYHLWLAVGCRACGDTIRLRYAVKDPATGDVFPSAAAQELVVQLGPGEFRRAAGLPALLPGAIWNPDVVLPEGTHVLLEAEVRDDSGATQHAARVEVVLGATEDWYPGCDPDPETCGAPGAAPCCTG